MRQNHSSSKSAEGSGLGGTIVGGATSRSVTAPAEAALARSTIQSARPSATIADVPEGPGRRRVRYDRPGHLAAIHADRLRHMSQGSSARDEFELVFDSAAGDDFATELAEQAVRAMAGGGGTWLDTINAQVDEEEGGPFLEPHAGREFASRLHVDRAVPPGEAVPTPGAGNFGPPDTLRRRGRS